MRSSNAAGAGGWSEPSTDGFACKIGENQCLWHSMRNFLSIKEATFLQIPCFPVVSTYMAKLFCFWDSLAKTTEGLMYKSQEAFGKRFLGFPNFFLCWRGHLFQKKTFELVLDLAFCMWSKVPLTEQQQLLGNNPVSTQCMMLPHDIVSHLFAYPEIFHPLFTGEPGCVQRYWEQNLDLIESLNMPYLEAKLYSHHVNYLFFVFYCIFLGYHCGYWRVTVLCWTPFAIWFLGELHWGYFNMYPFENLWGWCWCSTALWDIDDPSNIGMWQLNTWHTNSL